MNQEQLTKPIGQFEITYRELSRDASALADANGTLVRIRDLPEEAIADRCAQIEEEVNKALTLANRSVEECASAACVLYPKKR